MRLEKAWSLFYLELSKILKKQWPTLRAFATVTQAPPPAAPAPLTLQHPSLPVVPRVSGVSAPRKPHTILQRPQNQPHSFGRLQTVPRRILGSSRQPNVLRRRKISRLSILYWSDMLRSMRCSQEPISQNVWREKRFSNILHIKRSFKLTLLTKCQSTTSFVSKRRESKFIQAIEALVLHWRSVAVWATDRQCRTNAGHSIALVSPGEKEGFCSFRAF